MTSHENSTTDTGPGSATTPAERELESQAIDQLAEAHRDAGDQESQIAMWRAVFALDRWFFIARGEGRDTKPFLGTIDGQAMLLAFTSPARAREFALRNGFGEEEASRVLAIPGPDVVPFAEQFLGFGVQALVVDQGRSGFWTDLRQLGAMRRFLFPKG